MAYNIFERESIDTALLNQISRILHCDFFSMYSSQKDFGRQTMKHYSEAPMDYYKQSEQLEALRSQHEALQQEVQYLKKIVALLESKNVGTP